VTSSTPSDDSTCVQLNPDSGQPYWVGQASPELSNAAQEFQEQADAHTDSPRGVNYCTHYEGLVLFASAKATAEAMESVADVSSRYPSVEVTVEQGGLSLEEINAAVTSVASQTQNTPGIVSVGPNITTGGIEIGIDGTQINQEQAQQTVVSLLSRTPLAPEQLPISFVTQTGTYTNSTRAADFSPYAMGAELLFTLSGTTAACSAGDCSGCGYQPHPEQLRRKLMDLQVGPASLRRGSTPSTLPGVPPSASTPTGNGSGSQAGLVAARHRRHSPPGAVAPHHLTPKTRPKPQTTTRKPPDPVKLGYADIAPAPTSEAAPNIGIADAPA
jgi:hypothetical protein